VIIFDGRKLSMFWFSQHLRCASLFFSVSTKQRQKSLTFTVHNELIGLDVMATRFGSWSHHQTVCTYIYSLLTYLRSWALPENLPIVQPFRKFPAILRNPKVHHPIHKSPPLAPILSHFDPVHTIPSYLSTINFNIVHPLTYQYRKGKQWND
jgi:hypothetical protein